MELNEESQPYPEKPALFYKFVSFMLRTRKSRREFDFLSFLPKRMKRPPHVVWFSLFFNNILSLSSLEMIRFLISFPFPSMCSVSLSLPVSISHLLSQVMKRKRWWRRKRKPMKCKESVSNMGDQVGDMSSIFFLDNLSYLTREYKEAKFLTWNLESRRLRRLMSWCCFIWFIFILIFILKKRVTMSYSMSH